MPDIHRSQYQSLRTTRPSVELSEQFKDDDLEAHSDSTTQQFYEKAHHHASFISRLSPPWWIIHSFLIALNVLVGLFLLRRYSSSCPSLWRHELGEWYNDVRNCFEVTRTTDFASNAISYEDKVFNAAGFHEDFGPPSPFEGPRTAAVDAAWNNLTTIGMVFLNAQQNDALVKPTVESRSKPGNYPVALGVFHQLHCLNYLRILLDPREGGGKGETDEMRSQHKSKLWSLLTAQEPCA